MSLIDATFVEARLGVTLTATQTTQVEAYIDDASAIVLDVGDPEWTSVDVPAAVKGVVFQMVRRAYKNPEGYRSEQIGEYRYSRSDDVAAGGLTMTRQELRVVRRAAGLANVGTVGVRRPNDYERQWVTDLQTDDELVL